MVSPEYCRPLWMFPSRKSDSVENFKRPRKYLSKYCCTLVRRNSKPNFTSCLAIFQEKPSISCTLESTRCRGSVELAPGWAKKLDPPLAITETRIIGSPESAGPDPEHVAPGAVPPGALLAVHKPIELGWKLWSSGKNPSAKRFQPRRNSF